MTKDERKQKGNLQVDKKKRLKRVREKREVDGNMKGLKRGKEEKWEGRRE